MAFTRPVPVKDVMFDATVIIDPKPVAPSLESAIGDVTDALIPEFEVVKSVVPIDVI
jgi:hypothetical protein